MTSVKCGCARCGFLSKSRDKCLITGRAVDAERDFCSNCAQEPTICQICKKITLAPVIEEIDGQPRILCQKCSEDIGTCAGCAFNEDNCDFKTNPSPLPFFKTVVQQQGMAVAQMQILNPERQAITCALGCKCWNATNKICNKECGCCGNYALSKEIFKDE